ncbi:LOW QUALITY PROTEIN: D-3-phosphoglycerate dehydrogenase [Geomicrobium sp. JCM 19039]|nr:LOW QUALITY PROTEIN: D-3-phosphoglycerate dehydrogenase [Geomicrobium sp. JCM 19039]
MFVGHPIERETRDYLEQHCELAVWNEPNKKVPAERLRDELQRAEGAMLTSTRVDAQLLADAKKLKVVSTVSVGYDAFDVAAFQEYGVLATHTPYVLDETVADSCLGLMISSSRRIAELHEYIKKGEWQPEPDSTFFGQDLHHRTLGIIGMGRIGEKVVRRARLGFEMDVVYHNRSRQPEVEQNYEAQYMEFDDLLQHADIVVVMVPLTEETTGLISTREFGLMKPTSILVNAARGPVVDEDALVTALREKQIFAAGLDVFDQEPLPANHSLMRLDNVTLTPHIGSSTYATTREMEMCAAKNLVQALQGDTPQDLIKELKD